MADTTRQDVVVVETPKAQLEARLERISNRALSVAEEAYEVAAEAPSPEELASWTPRRRKLFFDANKTRHDIPAYLDFAFRYNEAVNRREQSRDGARVGVNIENAVINLPAPLPPASEHEVKYVDIETLKGEGPEKE
jgi:hypothetical protein